MVNNVTRVAGIFFIKTLYSVAVSLLCVILNMPFPFIPIQVTLIDLMIEAMPSFLTMLEPDPAKVKGRFLPTVLKRALPPAAAVVWSMLVLMGITAWLSLPADGWQSTLYFIVALLSMLSVILSLRPMNVLRFVVCVLMIVGFFAAVILFPSLLQLTNTAQVSFLLPWVLISALAMELLVWLLLRRKA